MWFYLALAAALLAYSWISKRYSYWTARGVPTVNGVFPLGNLVGIGRRHMAFMIRDCYRKLKTSGKKFGGIYFFVNPVVLALDLDFVKDVLVKDFQYFHDRGVYYNEKDDPLSAHLISLDGSKWKNLRTKLTPTFTSGKMKMMYSTITAVGERMQDHLADEIKPGDPIEIRDFLARFTTDIIGSCAFGLECNSLVDPETMFRQMSRKAFITTPTQFLKAMFGLTFRDLARKMGLRLFRKDVSEFFMGVVRDTIEYRERNKVNRNDFMDLLIKLKNAEPLEEGSDNLGPLTFNEIAAQAFLFFLAGFETSSTTLSYCMYELARNPDIQDKARKSVSEVLKQHGSMSYEAVQDMKYLECCINESLRKYPPVANIFRDITMNYKVPNSGVILEKGYRVAIPVYGIHHDPEYYPDPETFNPDRFTPEQSTNRHPMAFLPFGEGPRNCIGLRFGMLQTKVGLAYLLQKGLWLKVEKVE
ncbi:hypothetical protein quinque_011521 [Culex quinquefasciatus]